MVWGLSGQYLLCVVLKSHYKLDRTCQKFSALREGLFCWSKIHVGFRLHSIIQKCKSGYQTQDVAYEYKEC